jgi:tRNA(Ile)-lysidine synthase
MAGLGPFEARPRVGVAVSGGPDSLALILLCHRWAKARGGQAIALCVDHALRPESAAEVRQVARWMKARGIRHHTLRWARPGGAPSSALQAAARAARYALLTDWCRQRGVLHLALAHHAGDQAETSLMRLARGGGPDGLAGMSAIVSRGGVRLIRPLLPVAPARLRATLSAAGQSWIEDPSNANTAFERVRWRGLIAADQVAALSAAAAEIGEERQSRERAVNDLLASVRLDPAGFLRLPLSAMTGAAPELAERALGRCLIAIGGEAYAPSQESLGRLRLAVLSGTSGRTLAGCRIVRRDNHLFVFREVAAASERLPARAGVPLRWDGRFDLLVPRSGTIARLGEAGWNRLAPAWRPKSIPRDAVLALPALWRAGRPVALGWAPTDDGFDQIHFRPAQPLAPSGFTVAKLNVNII